MRDIIIFVISSVTRLLRLYLRYLSTINLLSLRTNGANRPRLRARNATNCRSNLDRVKEAKRVMFRFQRGAIIHLRRGVHGVVVILGFTLRSRRARSMFRRKVSLLQTIRRTFRLSTKISITVRDRRLVPMKEDAPIILCRVEDLLMEL